MSAFTGFYFAVLEEGEVATGDSITLVSQEEHHVSITDITLLNSSEKRNKERLRRAIDVESLPESWREFFTDRLQNLNHK